MCYLVRNLLFHISVDLPLLQYVSSLFLDIEFNIVPASVNNWPGVTVTVG